jgi:hypothetical protein
MLTITSRQASRSFFHFELLAAACCSLYLFSSMPFSTFSTVELKVAKVSPIRVSTRDCHPSSRRSSMSRALRSSTRPPKMVSIVDELRDKEQLIKNPRIPRRNWTYFELPNILWKRLNEKSGFEAFASTRRFAEYAERSSGVRMTFPSLSFPDAESSSSLM